jgi:hypothetical protein
VAWGYPGAQQQEQQQQVLPLLLLLLQLLLMGQGQIQKRQQQQQQGLVLPTRQLPSSSSSSSRPQAPRSPLLSSALPPTLCPKHLSWHLYGPSSDTWCLFGSWAAATTVACCGVLWRG